MIGYVTLGTNDFDRATRFYDRLLAEIGARRLSTSDEFVYYGKRPGLGMLAVYRPHDGLPASTGNGSMIALGVRGREGVERMHALALSLGASDEGAPGLRGEGFYGAYFRDLDGHKLCAFTYEGKGPEV